MDKPILVNKYYTTNQQQNLIFSKGMDKIYSLFYYNMFIKKIFKMNNAYQKWLAGEGCCNANNFINIETPDCKRQDVCDCENILLEISKLHTDDEVLQDEIDDKQDVLIEGNGILIDENGVISVTGGTEGVSSAQCQALIEESISGKVDSTAFETFSGEVTTSLGEKALQSDLDTLNGVVTAHTANTDIHVTTAQTSAWDAKSNFSGSYNDLTNKPTIPTIWNGTKEQFDAITVKDPSTLYLVNE
jgi:hypothetical protein